MIRPWLYKLTETKYRERDSDPSPYASSAELSLLTQRGWEVTDYWDSRGFVGDAGITVWVPEHGVLHADVNTLIDRTDTMVEFVGFEKVPLFGGQGEQESETDKAPSCIPGGALMRHPTPIKKLFDMSRIVVRYFLYQPKERT